MNQEENINCERERENVETQKVLEESRQVLRIGGADEGALLALCVLREVAL